MVMNCSTINSILEKESHGLYIIRNEEDFLHFTEESVLANANKYSSIVTNNLLELNQLEKCAICPFKDTDGLCSAIKPFLSVLKSF
jgi:hypothetical protein